MLRFFLCLSVTAFIFNTQAGAQDASRFECGGKVEVEVWNAWEVNLQPFLQERQIKQRLIEQGDVYALYDFEVYARNLVSMARRCERTERLLHMARIMRMAFQALEPDTARSPGRRWICRGGLICNQTNGLLNKEVLLDSAQFLALAASVANALASSGKRLSSEEERTEAKEFVSDTVKVVSEHLLRWGDTRTIQRLRRLTTVRPEDVEPNSSALFFSDFELWSIAMYAELAGILALHPQDNMSALKISAGSGENMRAHLGALLRFFNARLSFRPESKSQSKSGMLADLDRGYWRLHNTNRYAGYESDTKPVKCLPSPTGKNGFNLEVIIPAESIPPRSDIGWDFSHSARFVHVADALDRNRHALAQVFLVKEAQMPPKNLGAAFAATLVAVIWNGSVSMPLFSNYWSGANGWYRVAYDNGTGQCREGYPPFGMSEVFATGGYATWSKYVPTIGRIAAALYEEINRAEKTSAPFIRKYYTTLSDAASVQDRNLAMLMFLPSLVSFSGH
jgi:hypothetical protein